MNFEDISPLKPSTTLSMDGTLYFLIPRRSAFLLTAHNDFGDTRTTALYVSYYLFCEISLELSFKISKGRILNVLMIATLWCFFLPGIGSKLNIQCNNRRREDVE